MRISSEPVRLIGFERSPTERRVRGAPAPRSHDRAQSRLTGSHRASLASTNLVRQWCASEHGNQWTTTDFRGLARIKPNSAQTRMASGFAPLRAEGRGFEPPRRFHAERFSRPPHSTALPPLRSGLKPSVPSRAERPGEVAVLGHRVSIAHAIARAGGPRRANGGSSRKERPFDGPCAVRISVGFA